MTTMTQNERDELRDLANGSMRRRQLKADRDRMCELVLKLLASLDAVPLCQSSNGQITDNGPPSDDPAVEAAAAVFPRAKDAEMAAETRRRIYYQDIVYAVCCALDKINHRASPSSGVVCGTESSPSTDVQDAMTKVAAELDRLRGIVDRLDKTDDGAPLVPLDHVFVVAVDRYDDDHADVRVLECKYMDPTDPETECWPFESVERGNLWEQFTVLSKWSTREAAEVAKAKEAKP